PAINRFAFGRRRHSERDTSPLLRCVGSARKIGGKNVPPADSTRFSPFSSLALFVSQPPPPRHLKTKHSPQRLRFRPPPLARYLDLNPVLWLLGQGIEQTSTSRGEIRTRR